MNRIFKTIRNPMTGIVTAASELAKGGVVSSRNTGKRNFLALLTMALLSQATLAEVHEFEITGNNDYWIFKPVENESNAPLVSNVNITVDLADGENIPYFIYGTNDEKADALNFENNQISANIDNRYSYDKPSVYGVTKSYYDDTYAAFMVRNNAISLSKGLYDNVLGSSLTTFYTNREDNYHQATFNRNSIQIGAGVEVNDVALIQAENIGELDITQNSLILEGATVKHAKGIYVDNSRITEVAENQFSIVDSSMDLFQGIGLLDVNQADINNNDFLIEGSTIGSFQAITALSYESFESEGTHRFDNNRLTIKDSNVQDFSGISVNGGAFSQSVSHNQIKIEDSTLRGKYIDLGFRIHEISPAIVISGMSMTHFNVTGNSVYIKNSDIGFDIHAGSNETYPFSAISVISAGATINHNTLDINNQVLTNITGIKFEGFVESTVKEDTQSIEINRNSIAINGGQGTSNIIGIEEMHLPVTHMDEETYTFTSNEIQSTTNHNTLQINHVDIDGDEIVGIKKTVMDHMADHNTVSLTTNDNILSINDSHIRHEKGVTGISTTAEYHSWNDARPDLFDMLTLNASHNTLNITHSEISGDVQGSKLELGTSSPWGQPLMSGGILKVESNNNTLNLTGGTFNGNIYGIYLTANNNRDVTEASINTNHNTINLSGDLKINNDSSIYGAYKDEYFTPSGFTTLNYDLFTGNTLNFSANQALSINHLGGFEFYNFILDPDMKDPYITANTINLESQDLIFQEGTYQKQFATVNVTGIKGGRELQNGETFILLAANESLTGDHGATQKSTLKQGISLEYDVTTKVDTEGKQVIATIGQDVPLTPLEPATPIIPLTPLEPATPIIPLTPLEPATPIIPLTPLEPATPIIPLTPLEPATPIIPLTPLEPATPIIPLTPLEPATPIIPLTPLEPATPIIPLTPLEPATPIIPLTPLEPATPIIPLTPLEPATPIIPLTPLEPATPIIPLTPLEPATPIIPLTPLEPATPIIPLTPLEPATPTVPLTPLEPATPVAPSAPRVNSQLKSLNEGFLAGAMLVNRAQDMITNHAIKEIKADEQQGFNVFGTMMGSHNRYSSGSHVKSNDFMMALGLSYQVDALTLAAFAESSWSDYDTYNDFKDRASVHGDGDARAYGLGFIARYEWNNGVYLEGSISTGKLRNTFDTQDLQDAGTGEFAHYSLRTRYTSAHIGMGYQFSMNERNTLDLSGKYLWSHISGKNVTVANDPIHFDSMTSKRMRINLDLTHHYSHTTQFNAGIGYEYEFDGKATGSTYGRYAIDAPSVKGSTGIISVGMTIKPEFNQRLEFKIQGEGTFGKRRGASLSIGGKYEF